MARYQRQPNFFMPRTQFSKINHLVKTIGNIDKDLMDLEVNGFLVGLQALAAQPIIETINFNTYTISGAPPEEMYVTQIYYILVS